MQTKIIALTDSAERVFAVLCSQLESHASGLRARAPASAISSIARVALSSGGTVQIGASILPLLPVSPEALQRRFRLSPTQARVAVLLAARLTNAEIADVLGCAASTVRTHVGWVFRMLEVHHRDEVAYVLCDPALQDGSK